MSSPPPPEIKTYTLTSTDPSAQNSSSKPSAKSTALALLKLHLPACLPLYRRLQFGRFFEASCLLSNLDLTSNFPVLRDEHQPSQPWFLAFVDRSTRPETEVWFFGSWESPTSSPNNYNNDPEANDVAIDALLRAVVASMRSLEIPASIHQDVLDGQEASLTNGTDTDSAGLSRKDYGGHAADTNIMLWGATHERTTHMLQRLGLLTLRFKTVLQPNWTFIWDVDSLPPVRTDLPEGLRWGELRKEHFALVRSRTQIPRQDRTLAVLPNVGIFPTFSSSSEPIAWAFVGLDASLTTLHVEPEWRGKGLAKAVTTKLFREKMGLFWEEGVRRLAHGYVIVGNKESEGMCKSLGGKSEWEVYWVRVDLGLL